MTFDGRRVAIVHERFTEPGGSEQVVAQLHKIWPEAHIHTPIFDRAALPAGLADAEIRSSGLQRVYRGGPRYAHLLPLLPGAMRHLDLGDAAVVVASHHAFANRVTVPPGAKLVSYTYTPARWMWDPAKRKFEIGGRLGRSSLAAFAALQRGRDRAASERVDLLIVISRAVADRAEQWWGRSAMVIPPPVDVDYFTPDPSIVREDFFLLAGRMVPYKRPEVAVAAARAAGVRLVVVGGGRSESAVRAVAGPDTELLGPVDRATLRHLFRTCQALVFPGEEDFGIVPVEAQACGAPVLGLRAGGVVDSVLDGTTGTLYSPSGDEHAEMANLVSTLRSFDPNRFNSATIRANAERFAAPLFRERMSSAVDELMLGTAPLP